MAIDVICPQCHKPLQVRDEYAGRSLACPRCSESIAVPAEPPPRTEDDAPRKRGRRGWSSDGEERKSPYKPCPKCGGTEAERVVFSFWGSFYGPALLCHVRCPDCGTAYNGRSGRSNLLGILIFVAVPLLGIVGVIAGLILFIQYVMMK